MGYLPALPPSGSNAGEVVGLVEVPVVPLMLLAGVAEAEHMRASIHLL